MTANELLLAMDDNLNQILNFFEIGVVSQIRKTSNKETENFSIPEDWIQRRVAQ